MYNLEEAVKGYLHFAKKEGILKDVLSQNTDEDLEKMWATVENENLTQSIIKPKLKHQQQVVSSSWFMQSAFA